MSRIEYEIDKLDAFKGKLQNLLKQNATERYIADDTDTPQVMYLFSSDDLAYCFLSHQQQVIYNKMSDEFQTTKEISDLTGLPTKNISSILAKIEKDTNLIIRDGSTPKRIKWRKL